MSIAGNTNCRKYFFFCVPVFQGLLLSLFEKSEAKVIESQTDSNSVTQSTNYFPISYSLFMK